MVEGHRVLDLSKRDEAIEAVQNDWKKDEEEKLMRL
jgi:hypothetical protein